MQKLNINCKCEGTFAVQCITFYNVAAVAIHHFEEFPTDSIESFLTTQYEHDNRLSELGDIRILLNHHSAACRNGASFTALNQLYVLSEDHVLRFTTSDWRLEMKNA